MAPMALTIAVFLVALGFLMSVFYFLVIRPLEQKQTLARFETLQKAIPHSIDFQEKILHEDVISANPRLNKLFRKIPCMLTLHIYIKQSAKEISVGSLLAISIFSGLIVLAIGLFIGLAFFLSLIIAIACGSIPFIAIGAIRRKRFDRFAELFPDAMDFLARSVRAGHAFTSGLEMIAQEMDEPLAGEFRRVFEQQNLGMPIKEALQNLVLRMPLSDVQIFTTALVIQRETGGNLAEILDNLSFVMRERFKMTRYIQTVTAQGRLSRNILMALPPALLAYMYAVNRPYTELLFTEPSLRIALYAVIVLQVVGFFWIQKIIQPKV